MGSAVSGQRSVVSVRSGGTQAVWGGVLGAVIGLLVIGGALPGHAEELKIGYVDLIEVFNGYERTKASDAALEKEGKQKQVEVEGRLSELKKLRQNLELLNDQAREARAREVEKKSDELQQLRTSAARDLGRERDKVTKSLLAEIERGIEEYAKAYGFNLILDRRALVYGQPASDVTDGVLALLNNRLKGSR